MSTVTKSAAKTREAWLVASLPHLVRLITAAGGPEFQAPLMSVGFPYKCKGRGKAIGQCWLLKGEKQAHIFVHPCLDDPKEVLATLLHELIHASVGIQCKHGGQFAVVAKAAGLEGPMTATHAGPELAEELDSIIDRLGLYPHRALNPKDLDKLPKQSTRMLKVVCAGCGYTVRTSKKWLEVGVPTCPCGCAMEAEEPEGGDGDEGEGEE